MTPQPLWDSPMMRPPAWIQSFSDACELTAFPNHWQMFFFSFVFWQGVFGLSVWLSPRLASSHYPTLSRIKKIDWHVHWVSTVHAIWIVMQVIPLIYLPNPLHMDRVFGYFPPAGTVLAIASGYFLWDTLISLYYLRYFGIAFLIHGILCFCLYFLAFRPFLMYYGMIFLLFELSTPFLNFHWFLDKCQRSGTRIQLINGFFLLGVFLLVRLGYGLYASYGFYST